MMSNICVISANKEWKELLLQHECWKESVIYEITTDEQPAENTALVILALDATEAEHWLGQQQSNANILLLCQQKAFARFQLLAERWATEKSVQIWVEALPLRLENFFSLVQKSTERWQSAKHVASDHGKWQLLPQRGIIKKDAVEVALTEKEVLLIKTLLKYAPEPVARDVLLKEVWQYHKSIDTHTLETHIYRLRQKVKDSEEVIVTTEAGYQLLDFLER